MNRFFLYIHDKLSENKALSIFLLLIMTALCVFSALRLDYKENIADFLPSNPEKEKYTSVYEDLSDQGQITVIFSGEDKYELMDAVDDFESNWAKADTSMLVSDLRCKIDDKIVFDAIDFIRDNQPLFLTESDYTRIDSLLAQPDYVATCLTNIKRMLALPTVSIVVEGAKADPLSLYTPSLQRLNALNATEGFVVEDEYLFNESGDKAFAFLTSPFQGSDTKNNALLVNLLDNVIKTTQASHPEVTVSAVGAPTIAVANAQQIKYDSFLSIALAIILIFSILMFTMARKRNLLWLGLSIVFGWIFALAVIALFKTSISIIVVGIGSVIVGIAVNYPLHYLDHIKQQPDRREALKDVIQPLVIGNITTVAAFACLIFVKAEAMHDLGMFGALMLIGTILFVMVFLPLFAVSPKKTHPLFVDGGRPQSERWRKFKLYAFWPLILVTLILAHFSQNAAFDSDLHNINYMTEQQKADLALLSGSMEQTGQTELMYLVAEGVDMEDALAQNEKIMSSLLASNSDSQDITVSGPYGLLPSIEGQQQSLDRWADLWNRHSDIPAKVRLEAKKAGFTEDAFSVFTKNIEKQYNIKTFDDMGPLTELCKAYTLQHDTVARVINFMHIPAEESEPLKHQLRQALPERAFAFSLSDVGNSLVTALSDDFDYILYVCSIVVFFFLCLSFGRLELSILAFLPLTIGWAWILGIMHLSAIKFNIVNIILATFIFGQGDDYTIFITEGLLYEYAYGKKLLKNYRNSVILSGILMFIGIGTLIFAKHPAMKSLAEVAIIGMATVVFMACYLPPIVFGWLTRKHGQLREVPITLRRIIYTALVLTIFFVAAFVIATPLSLIYIALWPRTKNKRYHYHQMIAYFMRLALKMLPGVTLSLKNNFGEKFEKPAVIIANHQSHLDLLFMMMLHPKVVLLTTDWVWKNPVYAVIIRYAEFLPVSDGYDRNFDRLQGLIQRGYSVIVFPEGTRSADGGILRFHKGAFQLAQALNIDILPVFIHGTHDVMPKNDLILREGRLYIEIGERMQAAEVKSMETRTLASHFRKLYISRMEEIRKEREDVEYVLPYVRYKYVYKGRNVERVVRTNLKRIKAHSQDINTLNYNSIAIVNSGYGELAWTVALVHRDIQVYAYEEDEDKYLIASHCSYIPENLHFIKGGDISKDIDYLIDNHLFAR